MNITGGYEFDFGFFAMDENYKTLNGAKFKITNYDKTKTLSVDHSLRDDGAHIFTKDDDLENVLDYFPEEYRTIFSNLKTKDDVLNLTNHDDFYVPLKVVETDAPAGYKKEEMIIFVSVHANYSYDSNNNVTGIDFYLYSNTAGLVMVNDDSNANYNQLIGYYDRNNIGNWEPRICEQETSYAFGQVATSNEDIWGSACFEVMYYFIHQKGEVELTITNTVNNVLKYNATTDRKLKYNITVKNNGNASSSNNIIVTNVPEGIEVDVDSISDRGVYNKSKNTITWTLDLLDPEEEYTFTYEAVVPESALASNEYIGNSYIMSNEVPAEVKSEDTVVNLSIANPDQVNNPSTGLYNISSAFFLVAVLLIVLFALKKKKMYLK